MRFSCAVCPQTLESQSFIELESFIKVGDAGRACFFPAHGISKCGGAQRLNRNK